jgi:Arc/MetJ-type ribon-helix-helix transcriptional regulator
MPLTAPVITMDFKSIANEALSGSKTDLPLSGSSTNILNELIGSGVFGNKADFIKFVMKAYMEFKVGGGSQQPSQADVSNLIQNTGIGNSLSQEDVQNKLQPLLTEAFKVAGQNKLF